MSQIINTPTGKELVVSNISDWRSVEHIPSGNSLAEKELNKKYGLPGVYQFCHVDDIEDVGDELIHESIGYIGQSKDIVNRTYTVRMPSGNHGVNRIIKQRQWNRGEVYVRWLFCETPVELENYLHSKMKNQFGYSFAWREASDGTDGIYSRALDALEGLTYEQYCDIIVIVKNKAREIRMLQTENELGAL